MTDNAMSPAAVDSERHEMEKGDDFATVREALHAGGLFLAGVMNGQLTLKYIYALSALSRIEAENRKLREALRNCDEEDWNYLLGVLASEKIRVNTDGRGDVRPGFWISVISATRAALDGG